MKLKDYLYYQDDWATIYCGDCLEVMPLIKEKIDLILADPPYGIGKANWDTEFSLSWMKEAAKISKKIGLMCGNWNLMNCPVKVLDLSYRWTLSAHIVNGMTRGTLGFGNWVPCVVYGIDRDFSDYKKAILEWCRSFGNWCRKEGIRNKDLDNACGTSSMGDWWTGRSLPWCCIPSQKHWENIKYKFNPPLTFDDFPILNHVDYVPVGDCRDFVIGKEKKPDHPTPKLVEVVSWFIKTIQGEMILDPFLGSGTTCVAAKNLNRKSIGIEINPDYCEIAVKRLRQEVFNFTK